ncbi:MAG: TlpA family protein disulfide reductase [Ktedonobacteraceae bacterium]|nr:TlpA family protein disulfide reductase [Ktedonobacteraceae bacterium]
MSKTLAHGIITIVVVGTLAIITLGLFRPASPISINQNNRNSNGTIQVGLHKGDAAPNFTLTTVDGQKMSLSDYRGRPVMLNFWMINCEGCQYEMPGMEKVYSRRQGAQKDLVVLGIDASDSATDIKQFALQHHYTYPMLEDVHSYTGQLYALRGTPTSYFIDRKGFIYTSNEGALDEGTLQQMIQQISA